jgi:hypothetical protein
MRFSCTDGISPFSFVSALPSSSSIHGCAVVRDGFKAHTPSAGRLDTPCLDALIENVWETVTFYKREAYCEGPFHADPSVSVWTSI